MEGLTTPSSKSTAEILKDSFKDLATHSDTIKYVPKDGALYKRLQSIIERDSTFCKQYHLEHFEAVRELMAELTWIKELLCGLKDIPIASKNISDILFMELQWSNEKDLAQDPNNGDLLAQQSIFKIWKTMQSQIIDSGAIDDAVLKEIMFHSQRYHNSLQPAPATATANSGLHQDVEVLEREPES
ncbi:MAG: hypothetical protein Q9200_006016, partial [Gallowayella weberi]